MALITIMIDKLILTARIKSTPLRMALLYAVLGGLWIFVTDWALHAFVHDPAAFVRLEMLKGWAYVAATAAILYLLVRRFERKRGEHELQHRMLLEQASDGIVIFDRQGRLLSANARICEMLGYTEEELLRLSVKDVFLPEDLAARPLRFPEMLEGKTVRTDRTFSRKDGTGFPVELTARMVKDDLFMSVIRDVTERRCAQEALRASEERYRLLFRNSPIGIFNFDAGLRVTDCNDAFLQLLKTGREDMIGLDMTRLRDQRPMPAIQKALDGRPGIYVGFYRAWPRQPEICISMRTAPMLDSRGSVQGGVGIVEDITDQVRMEESVQEQKRFAENLIENSAVATFVLDSRHRIIGWNRACEELTGRPAAAMLGTDDQWKPFYDNKRPTLADVVIDADFDRLPELYSAYSKSALAPSALHAEGWRANLNGRDRYILFDAAPIYGGKGVLIAAIQTLQDITERKYAEESLLESEQKLQAITDAAVDAIILIDEQERIVYWNPAAVGMFGFSSEEIAEKKINAIIPHRYRKRHSDAFGRFARTGQGALLGKTYEVFGLRKDGTELPVELSVSGIRLKGKWHSVGVIRDISDRKKLEQQLLHSQKMEAVGQLSGGLAHDFNNILTAIIGYGHILHMKMREEDPLRDNVRHLLESADRAAHLTRSLLAFSRKQALNARPVDLIEVLRRAEKLLRLALGEGIDLKTAFKHEALTINADAVQIEQVLMNLATNARDAMPHGGSFAVEIDVRELDGTFVRAYGYGEPGRYAVVSVTDTGAGMDEETRERIFEPFFTTKEVGKGTGLGLSMTYGIIKQHQGYINAYSEPGRGTTFRIYLPLIDEAGESAAKAAAIPEQNIPGGTETVLIAEDDAALRNLFRAVLEEFGYTVIEAEDGADAVDRFMKESGAISLVILDMIMPKKNGRDAYEEMKKVRPDIKALFVSGYTADRMLMRDLLKGGAEFALKPISPRDLLLKVRAVLDS